jgi:hypothetical protein
MFTIANSANTALTLSEIEEHCITINAGDFDEIDDATQAHTVLGKHLGQGLTTRLSSRCHEFG